MKKTKGIYLFTGYYDSSEDCYGPCFGNEEDFLQAIYYDVYRPNDRPTHIDKKKMKEFEKDKIIIRNKSFVRSYTALEICKEELDNPANKTEEDLIKTVNKRISNLSKTKNPKYKEKLLLSRINTLYSKVKGELIKDEILYNGKFLKTIKETYLLPNNEIVEKEKVVKNNGKDAVIIIPKTDGIGMDSKYIITFQQRINGKMLAEFPSGYIEENESPIEAAKRELEEETGYTSKDIFIIEEAYTSPGIDNSKTYIVFASSCKKTNTTNKNQTELLKFGLFSKRELEYLVGNNIMNGSLNKLAYYTLTSDSKPRKTLKP